MPDALDYVLRTPTTAEPVCDLASWLERLGSCPFERTVDRALWAGFEADRLGYAFVGGYQAALAKLVAMAGPTVWCSAGARFSLAATEAGGAHPRAIQTVLSNGARGLVLHGEKTFATLASAADTVLVVASRGSGLDGRPRLVLVRVPARAPGVVIEDRRALPFAPEIPHAKVTLTDVVVHETDVFPGDGYATYLKPFRTIEDVHVLAAMCGYVMKAARAHEFSRALVEELAGLVAALFSIAERDALDPVTHLALGGVFATARELIGTHDSEWEKADIETRERWRRDLGLLLVAEAVRQKRTDAAWKTLRPGA